MANITKRGASYRIRCSCGYGPNGNQVMKSMTWTPDPKMTAKQIEKELNRQAVLFEEKCRNGLANGNTKFQDFAEQWFEEYARSHLKTKTLEEGKALTKRVYPALGHIKIGKLRPEHFRNFYNSLGQPGQNKRTKEGLSAKTIWNYHAFCSSILGYAVKNEILLRNPCAAAAPKKPASEINCLDDVAARKFLDALEKEPVQDRAFFTLALLTGYRRGEMLGLEWPDVDFENAVITVRRTSQYQSKVGIYTDTPKTKRSQRSTKVSAALMDLLRELKVAQATKRLQMGDLWNPEWERHPRLFTTEYGFPLHPGIPGKHMSGILERNGLPRVTLHSLRHTNATLLISGGVDVRTVSGRLGHSQASTTMNIYAETIQSAEAAAADVLDNILLKKA